MARYAQSSSENISVQLGVGAAVVSGDVLYRDSDGLIKPLPNSESSLTVPTITETWRSNDISADNTGSNTGVCVLTSGDIVFLFRNATTVKFARYNPSGVLQGSVTTVETGLSGIVTMAICALTGGGFAIAYNNTSSTVRAAVYNSTGGVVKAAYQVAAYNASSIDITALLTGDFVVAYNNTSSGLFFTRYDSTGTIAGSETTIAASNVVNSNNDCAIRLATLSDGNFVVAWHINVTSVNFARYSAVGASLTASTQMVASSYPYIFVCRTDAGFIVGGTNGSGYLYYKVYDNSANVLTMQTTGPTTMMTGAVGQFKRAVYHPATGGMLLCLHGAYMLTNSYGQRIGDLISIGAHVSDGHIATDSTGASIYAISSVASSGYPYIVKYGFSNKTVKSYRSIPSGAGGWSVPVFTGGASYTSAGTMSSALMQNGDVVHAVSSNSATDNGRIWITDSRGTLKNHLSYHAFGSSYTHVAVLANGNIVLYSSSNSNLGRAYIYTPSFQPVGIVNVGAGSSHTAPLKVLGLPNGNFVCAWWTGGAVAHAIYSPTGTQVLGATTALSATANNNAANLGIANVSNGEYVIVAQNSASNMMWGRYSSSGSSLASGTLTSATASTKAWPVALPGGRFAILDSEAGSLYITLFSAGGTVINSARTTVRSGALGAAGNDLIVAPTGRGTIYLAGAMESGGYGITFMEISETGVILNERNVRHPLFASEAISMAVLSDGSALVSQCTATSAYHYTFQREVPIVGVASGSGAADNFVSVIVEGTAPTLYNWPTQTFNCIGAGGVKGLVSGKTAVLNNTVNSLG